MNVARIVVATWLTAGCTRKAPIPEVDAAAVASVPLEAGPVATAQVSAAPPIALARSPVSAAEARRVHVARLGDDPSLALAMPALEKHFAGAPAAGGFDVQMAPLSLGHRRAILLSEAGRPTSEARPFVFVTEESGSISWTKERPVAGILPPVVSAAIAAGPAGRVAIAACDPPTKSVALRLWDEDGSPFADFQVLDVEACDGLSLLYWPRRGWIVVAAGPDVTRARLITESGSPAWGRGLDLGARSLPGALSPASLAADTDDTFVLVQAVQPTKAPGSAYHALAFRYDAQGTAIWPAAVDLGELTRDPLPGERVSVARLAPVGVTVGIAEADAPSKAGGAPLRSIAEVDVLPSGAITRRRRARP